MHHFQGNIFQGEFDKSGFYLTEVKSITTGSILSEPQLKELHEYVEKQPDTCMLTLNDQIPILLQKEEVRSLIADLEQIIKKISYSS